MRKTSSGFFMVFCLAFIFGLAGCQPEGTAERAGQKTDNAGDVAATKAETAGVMDDAAITAKIKAEILSDPLLNVSQIEVTTTNGVVRLSGTVNSQQSIDRAMEIARSVKDVKSVDTALVY